jgi:hypothetical protein
MKTFQKPPAIIELEAKRLKVQFELNDVEAEINARCSHLVDDTKPRLSKVQAEALGVVDGVDVHHAGDDETREELSTLYHRRTVLQEALKEIDKRIQPLKSEHDKAACLQVRPEYIKIGARLLDAIKALCAASTQEKEFYEELRDGGIDSVASYLPRLMFHGDWKWDDPNGGVIHYWKSFVTENYPELKAQG